MDMYLHRMSLSMSRLGFMPQLPFKSKDFLLLPFFPPLSLTPSRPLVPLSGIYGYSFTEAGSRVFDLFHRKGLTAIINDQLISRVRVFFLSLNIRI